MKHLNSILAKIGNLPMSYLLGVLALACFVVACVNSNFIALVSSMLLIAPIIK